MSSSSSPPSSSSSAESGQHRGVVIDGSGGGGGVGKSGGGGGDDFHGVVVHVPTFRPEFRLVQQQLAASLPRATLRTLHRVEAPLMWRRFAAKKLELAMDEIAHQQSASPSSSQVPSGPDVSTEELEVAPHACWLGLGSGRDPLSLLFNSRSGFNQQQSSSSSSEKQSNFGLEWQSLVDLNEPSRSLDDGSSNARVELKFPRRAADAHSRAFQLSSTQKGVGEPGKLFRLVLVLLVTDPQAMETATETEATKVEMSGVYPEYVADYTIAELNAPLGTAM